MTDVIQASPPAESFTGDLLASKRREYRAFLESKVCATPLQGFEVDLSEINDVAKPHQKKVVQWGVRGGQRAYFLSFGLGKTILQLETVRLILERVGGRGLIGVPLGARQEFVHDAQERLLWPTLPRFIRSIDEAGPSGIYLTNYETIREGKLDPADFRVVSLDEADVLRSFGSKTFGEVVIQGGWDKVPYRFVATATPDPNDYVELLGYAQFLGVMDIGQAKTRFFKRDSEHADHLTLHAHKENEFWLWVASWAMVIRKPSDLGFSDEGYDLPPITINWHEVPSDHAAGAGHEKSGQGRMFKNSAFGVSEAAKEKRDSLDARVAKLLELRAEDPGAHRILWHDLEIEREAIEDALPHTTYGHWHEFRDGHPAALKLYERHYSAYRYADGRSRSLFMGPGEKMVLLTAKADALFGWRKFIDGSGQQGINCSVFRNEGEDVRSSDLIREAMAIAWLRWPGERLYTYVDAGKILSTHPGYCFKKAGWTRCGTTQGGLVILEALPGADIPTATATPACQSVYGSQDLDEREATVHGFAEGHLAELAAKPSVAGAGTNLQRHCSWAIFIGIGHKFRDLIQAIHRIHRFLQERPVRIDLIYTEAERPIRAQLEAKWKRYDQQTARLSELIREYGLGHAAMASTLERSFGVERREIRTPRSHLINGDAVEELMRWPADSVGCFHTSWPFSSQYEYTPTFNDFGHTDSNEHFFAQMDFVTPEVYRTLMPGRCCVLHIKDRVVPGGMTGLGYQTVYPFHADVLTHMLRHGFTCLGQITIVTDVVRENNQTYRLGYGEMLKDGSRMGVGLPEYLLILRKPPTDSSDGYADVPVTKTGEEYSLARWQVDAHSLYRSNGNRLLSPDEMATKRWDDTYPRFQEFSRTHVYDHEHHVAIGEAIATKSRLPRDFMLLPPASWHPDAWTDVTRMRSLNTNQAAANRVKHICPLPFDIVDRVIRRFSNPGDVVADYFAGLFTVPYRAIRLGRIGWGVELNAQYFSDGVGYCAAAERKIETPSLFDTVALEAEPAA